MHVLQQSTPGRAKHPLSIKQLKNWSAAPFSEGRQLLRKIKALSREPHVVINSEPSQKPRLLSVKKRFTKIQARGHRIIILNQERYCQTAQHQRAVSRACALPIELSLRPSSCPRNTVSKAACFFL